MIEKRMGFDLAYMDTHKLGLDDTIRFRCKACGKWLGDEKPLSHSDKLRQTIDEVLAQKPKAFDEFLQLMQVAGIGFPEKGTPQGGIISPLLSNIVLHELDW